MFQTAVKCDSLYPHLIPYCRAADGYGAFRRAAAAPGALSAGPTIDKSWVYGRFAMSEELRQIMRKRSLFREAILASQNDDKIKDYRSDIDRCQMKTEIRKTHGE